MPLSPVPHVLEFNLALVLLVKALQRVLPNGVEEVPQRRLARRVEMGLWKEIDACCLPRDNGGQAQFWRLLDQLNSPTKCVLTTPFMLSTTFSTRLTHLRKLRRQIGRLTVFNLLL